MITLDLTKIYAKNPDTQNYVEVNWGDISVFSRGGIDTSDATAYASDIISGKTAYARGVKITGSYVPLDTSDATATANVILKNETAYVDGVKITGTIESLERTIYMPSTINQTISANQYLSGDQIIMGDANLRPDFIKKGVLLFNTTGTYEGTDTSDANATSSDILLNKTAYVNGTKIIGEIESLSSTTYTPTISNQTISAGKYIAEDLTILGDNNLNAGNIKKDISIFGVVGTLEDSGVDTSDATATAADIMLGETAYANGVKLTGTHVDLDTSDATATSGDMKAGVTAYVNGNKITGNAYTRTSQVNAVADGLIDGTTHWLQAGFYNGIAFEAEPNLLPENIKDGVTIYGTTGTYTGGSGFEYNIFDSTSATSAQDIVDEYGGLITTTYDGGNFKSLAAYDWNTNPVGAKYDSAYSGIFICSSNVPYCGFYTNMPYNISGSFYLDLMWYMSTWINPTIKLCLISATDISDLQNKIINRNFDYSFDYVAANAFNNQEMYYKITGILSNDYYIYLEAPTATGGNEAAITKIQITGV